MIIDKKLYFNSKYYLTIINCLSKVHAKETRLIGGCVRDAILDKCASDISDVDIATNILPNEVMEILKTDGIKVIPTGIAFGTITAIIEDEHFEITTLRKDISCDGRHAKVEFTNDFAEDAMRRDFTINALSYCVFTHRIYDYFGGFEDLMNHKVRFIGLPPDRIKEDYLRILRFFRFSAHYGHQIDQDGLKACTELRSGLQRVSRERIKMEMDKFITSSMKYGNLSNITHVLCHMYQSQILDTIFTIRRFEESYISGAIEFAHAINVHINQSTIYALLFYKNQESLHMKILLQFGFSRKGSSEVLNIVYQIDALNIDVLHSNIDSWLSQIWFHKTEYLQYIIAGVAVGLIKTEIAIAFINEKNSAPRPIFEIDGNDVSKIGFHGAQIGSALKLLQNEWIASDFHLTRNELLKILHDKFNESASS